MFNCIRTFVFKIFTCLLITSPFRTLGQIDTVSKIYDLPDVSIIDEKWELGTLGIGTLSLDSLKRSFYSNQRISDWLQMEGLFYVKNYGLGQLNTLSYRGSTSNQNQVLWNGVPIQSPFNQSPDYAQIPITSMNVAMLKGSNPSLWGSGAGSSLLLTPNWIQPYFIQIQQQFGSFGLNQQSIFIQKKFLKHHIQVQAYRLFANNNFSFVNKEKPNAPIEKLQHAQTMNYGIQANYKILLKKSKLELHFWKQNATTQIPPVMTSDTSAQNQKDESLRLQAVYQTFIKGIKLSSQQSFLRDYLWYEDSIARIFSGYLSNQWFSDQYLQFSKTQNHFQFQIQNHWVFPYAENSMKLPKIWQRHSIVSNYLWVSKKKQWKFGTTYRQEYIQNEWIFPVLNISMHWNFYSCYYLKGSIGNSYRYASLNDRYWEPGGNPLLKPEKGIQWETSLDVKKKNLWLSITYYQNHYKDLIVWLPSGTFWSAQNMNQVLANGIEVQTKFQKSLYNHQWLIEISGFYGKSIMNKPRFENDLSYRKQLIYQPKYRWNAQLSWIYQNFSLHYLQLWNGYVYNTTDNSDWLPDFHLANLMASYQWKFSKQDWNINFQIKNLLNAQYQTIKNRPMPGRNYLIGFVWKLK